MSIKKLLLLFVIIIFFTSIISDVATAEGNRKPENIITNNNSAFALSLYNQLSKKDGNLFFSPLSISTALSMAYAGARGNTETQMAKVMNFLPDQNQQHSAYKIYLEKFDKFDLKKEKKSEPSDNVVYDGRHKPNFVLKMANSLWIEKSSTFKQTFLDTIQNNYGSVLFKVDFKKAFDAVRTRINTWIEQQTNGKIKDLIGPNILNSSTRFVIANAIYFNARWDNEFYASLTEVDNFYLKPETPVRVKMMHKQDNFRYMENEQIQMLELPYKNAGVSMYIILPKKVDGIKEIEASFNYTSLYSWFKQMKSQEVNIFLPKYKTTSTFKLKDTLSQMGMTDAFAFGKADFSGINGNKDLYISAVIHKAFIDVDEKGTEAAAATVSAGLYGASGMIPEPPKVYIFRADHPFIYLIRDRCADSILFMGRVVNPLK